jgi:hypothetical protein
MREIRRRRKPLERRTRALELERGAVLITERAAGKSDRDARAGREIRRAQLLPEVQRPAQRLQRRVRVVLGELELAARVRCGRR